MKEFVLIVVKSYLGIIQVKGVEVVRKYYMNLELEYINQYLEAIEEEIVLVGQEYKKDINWKVFIK